MEFNKFKILGLLMILIVSITMLGTCHARRLREVPKENHNTQESNQPVRLSIDDDYAIVDNGIVQVTFAIPGGHVSSVQYGGIDNVLDTTHKQSSRGYWDIGWKPDSTTDTLDWLTMENFKVIRQDENQVELSFAREWNGSLDALPINMDKRFVMLRGSSGLYNYLVLDHQEGWPASLLSQIRVAYRLDADKFQYMVISDDIQKMMPTLQDIEYGHTLAYREAVQWTNQSDPLMRTEVEDKYQYSQDMKDQQVHGWISTDGSSVGFWLIKPTTEFYSAGPFKQELTSHLGPISLIDFFSGHYGGQKMNISIGDGESWQKVIGPYFVYLNQASNGENPNAQLWSMAKDKLQEETEKWPYDFPESQLYAKANQRGSLKGRLFIRDGQANSELVPASSAWVGLAAPGDAGSWQMETKGYQFWTQAHNDGTFIIQGIHEGEYDLYAWVPGFIGDYKYNSNIVIQPGNKIELGEIVYEPPRNGPTLWEIGVPDRTAAEFFVPNPRPELVNPVFLNNDKNKFRQYGLWDRYTDLYPDQDLIYIVGASDYTEDLFYAHVPRRVGTDDSNEFEAATWQIRFQLQDVNPDGMYTLRLALAATTTAKLRVQVNSLVSRSGLVFSSGLLGFDNSIARHGIHGLYTLFSINVPGSVLQNGMNTLYLTQAILQNPFCGVMYDYIRLEAPKS